jgi:hypothetical protein
MADDENSDFVGNAAEQKVIKGTAANSLSGYHAPGLKKIVACLRPGSRNNEARCKTPLRALESQRARSSPLSRQCPNRPSDEGQATSASTAFDRWSSSSNDMPRMDSPQIPHRNAELLRYLHLRRAGPMEAIPVGVLPGQLSRSLVNPVPVSTSAMVAVAGSLVSTASKARTDQKTAT